METFIQCRIQFKYRTSKAFFDIELNIEIVPTEPIDTIEWKRTMLIAHVSILFNSLYFYASNWYSMVWAFFVHFIYV